MSQRMIAGSMIALGAILIGTGMFMDVTVETGYGSVVNLHKVSQQQVLVIVGGIVFISGILLFGFWRLKQTTGDESKGHLRAKERQEKLLEGAEDASRAIGEVFVGLRAKFITKTEGLKRIIFRVLAALFSVWVIQLYGPDLLYVYLDISVNDALFSLVVFGAAIAYSLLARPFYVVISHLLLINIASIVLCFAIMIYAQLTHYFGEDGLVEEMVADAIRTGIMLLVSIIFSLALLYLVRSKR